MALFVVAVPGEDHQSCRVAAKDAVRPSLIYQDLEQCSVDLTFVVHELHVQARLVLETQGDAQQQRMNAPDAIMRRLASYLFPPPLRGRYSAP